MRFEALTEVNMMMLVLCVVTPCGLVVRHIRFVGTFYLHLQH
jgi:hypothetical protein